MRRFRIALSGFSHETNTFSAVATEYEDFRIIRGDSLLQERFGGRQGKDAAADVQLKPCLFARVLPGGPIKRDAYLRLKRELLEMFESTLPVDGIYLDLHGAAEVEDIGDGVGDFIQSLRRIAGPEVVIPASLDLHGNISPQLAGAVNILTAYRTAPHRDMEETRMRAFRHLLDAFRNGSRPKTVLIKVPLLLPGEAAVTDVEPARSLYAWLDEIGRVPGLLDSTFLLGCCWTDSIHTSASVLLVAEQDRNLADNYARSLAEDVWAHRHRFRLPEQPVPVDEAIRLAMSARKHPVFISDSGDNITGGAGGDIPLMIDRLLAAGARNALIAGITDPQAVARCAAAGQRGGETSRDRNGARRITLRDGPVPG